MANTKFKKILVTGAGGLLVLMSLKVFLMTITK